MKIYAKSKHSNSNQKQDLPTLVNELGDYLAVKKKSRLEGVYNVEKRSNQYYIYTTILYQIPLELRKQLKKYKTEFEGKEEDIYTQNIFLNITTYGQYIRVYLTVLNEKEPTLGFLRLDKEDLMSFSYCKQKVLHFIKESIEAEYEDYEVLI